MRKLCNSKTFDCIPDIPLMMYIYVYNSAWYKQCASGSCTVVPTALIYSSISMAAFTCGASQGTYFLRSRRVAGYVTSQSLLQQGGCCNHCCVLHSMHSIVTLALTLTVMVICSCTKPRRLQGSGCTIVLPV